MDKGTNIHADLGNTGKPGKPTLPTKPEKPWAMATLWAQPKRGRATKGWIMPTSIPTRKKVFDADRCCRLVGARGKRWIITTMPTSKQKGWSAPIKLAHSFATPRWTFTSEPPQRRQGLRR